MSMQYNIKVDQNSREIVPYTNPHFPIEIWTGNFSKIQGRSLPLHWHPEFEFAFVVSGEIIYTMHSQTIVLKPDDCIFINKDVMHIVEPKHPNKNSCIVTIAFPAELLAERPYSQYIDDLMNSHVPFINFSSKSDMNKSVVTLLKEIYQHKDISYGFELFTISRITELLLIVLNHIRTLQPQNMSYRQDLREDEIIKKSLEYIYENYSEQITVEDIANIAHISKNTCFRYFRKNFNKTPLEVLTLHRLTVAKTLLDSKSSISDIAFSCGFNSLSYFSRQFQNHFGLSPKQYRKMISGSQLQSD